MNAIQYQNSIYRSPEKKIPLSRKIFPSFLFYCQVVFIVFRAAGKAKQGRYDAAEWAASSHDILRAIEDIGVRVEIAGIENIMEHSGPAVIIGNHMSMMETMLLPGIIAPVKDVTFVIKDSLLEYPVFKHVMRAREPIALSRTNPRQDFKVVMTEGVEKLGKDISIIVFPQTTRSHIFDPAQMSSIGVKLAKKAGVSVIPLALKTDGWKNGRMIKDLGTIDTDKKACFAFGKPMEVSGKGGEAQQAVNDFIAGKLEEWQD